MTAQDEPIKIIGNESNAVIETETSETTHADGEAANASDQSASGIENEAVNRSTHEIATADGAIIETLDTALHNKPGVAEGTQVSGSNRADYYESRSYGKTDVEEELDALNGEPS